jgi:hypothetical protein
MPRTYTAPEFSRLLGDYNVHTRVEVRAGGVWRELTNLSGTGRNYFDEFRWSRAIDAPVMTGTLRLLREVLGWSIAPAMTASPANTLPGSYVPLARVRATRSASPRRTPPSASAPVTGDWKEVFLGRIDDPDWGGDDGTIEPP